MDQDMEVRPGVTSPSPRTSAHVNDPAKRNGKKQHTYWDAYVHRVIIAIPIRRITNVA